MLQLKYFEAVARYENMTTASRELCVAQPAISQSISRLKEDLGVELFSREGKKIRLNACGRHLSSRITPILGSLETIRLELAEIADHSGTLIGLKVLSGSTLLPDLLLGFQQIYPQIGFRLIQNPAEPNYDLCIASAAAARNRGDTVLLDEEILIAVPDNSCYRDNDYVQLRQLKDEGFISLSKNLTFRAIMDEYCCSIQFAPKIVFESDSPATVRGLVRAGAGVAFWPSRTWGEFTRHVKALHISDMDVRRVITLSVPEGKVMPKQATLFSTYVMDFFKNL